MIGVPEASGICRASRCNGKFDRRSYCLHIWRPIITVRRCIPSLEEREATYLCEHFSMPPYSFLHFVHLNRKCSTVSAA